MNIVFLASTVADLRWFKRYYVSVSPEGKSKAVKQFLAILNLLKSNPRMGEYSTEHENVREYPVLQTPFTFVYRIREDRIEILRVADNRSNWRTQPFG